MWTSLVVISALLLVVSLAVFTIWSLVKVNRQTQASLAKAQTTQVEIVEQLLSQQQVVVNLLAAKDPLAFQQIQAVSSQPEFEQPYRDMSDEAEAVRELAREGRLDELGEIERAALSAIGIDINNPATWQ